MESLIELNNEELKKQILKTDFYEKLLKCFLEFPLNTFLQLHFDKIFHTLIKDESITMEEKITLFKDIHMFEMIYSFWQDNQQFTFPSQREFRHGYLAFTTKLANTFKEVAKDSPEFLELVSTEEWKEFLEKDVEKYNQLNSIVLANRNRKDSEEMDNFEDDMNFKDLEERDDIDDDDDEDDNAKSRNSMRETLQTYDPSKATEDHESDYVSGQVEVDDNEDKLFSGIERYQDQDSSSDEDTPIPDASEEEEEDNVSENSDYYDNSYWQINQYSIDDLLMS